MTKINNKNWHTTVTEQEIHSTGLETIPQQSQFNKNMSFHPRSQIHQAAKVLHMASHHDEYQTI